jgi:hypothetical protein
MIPHGFLLDGLQVTIFVGADISMIGFANDIFSCAASKVDLHSASNRRVNMHRSVQKATMAEDCGLGAADVADCCSSTARPSAPGSRNASPPRAWQRSMSGFTRGCYAGPRRSPVIGTFPAFGCRPRTRPRGCRPRPRKLKERTCGIATAPRRSARDNPPRSTCAANPCLGSFCPRQRKFFGGPS